MSVLRRLTLMSLPLLISACGAEEEKVTTEAPVQQAAPAAKQTSDQSELRTQLSKLGVSILNIQPSDIDGLMEVQTNGGVLFSSPDGKHFIAGTLYALDENGAYKDVLAERQAPINAEKITKFSDSVIEYKADNEKYVVTVFTDITCGYCVRLHNQMQGYNDLGITVRYMAYPRQGATGSVAEQMATIWCAEDPKSAIHNAKVDRKFDTPSKDLEQCKQTIQSHYQLGQELGISGTPAIFLPSGELVGGFLPPAQLIKRLEQK
ncbi:bifunctional protein-disulfide isomerase/oxidoreductase DsbC [Vibrio sagamiensis]|uniref:Thiol:disulfide interchange protein n=1 Tax=Vibrio sagamiensis NBRC 104589 TaxID=1219064 RepID=A0A511QAC9_9VIBR|nr:bifunctional protein-disulfide isomerase/oxidoreductase DsbC [Vibrio sagamiensis]PNQ64434.1 bifunctional protein-disulfide isomerase/oxidoreductase DsbC [Vibrio agarivorans]GEM74178.1 thiol:disulfide interchange protein DsbC [Vibrio sagamiensis NBRC 104589]